MVFTEGFPEFGRLLINRFQLRGQFYLPMTCSTTELQQRIISLFLLPRLLP